MLYGYNVEWLVAYMNQTSSSLEKKKKILFSSLIKRKSGEKFLTLSRFHSGSQRSLDIGIKRIIVACL